MLLGTEGAGLSEHWTRAADVRVRIPMHAGIDSLNVAAAAAVACYALRPPRCRPLSTTCRAERLTLGVGWRLLVVGWSSPDGPTMSTRASRAG